MIIHDISKILNEFGIYSSPNDIVINRDIVRIFNEAGSRSPADDIKYQYI